MTEHSALRSARRAIELIKEAERTGRLPEITSAIEATRAATQNFGVGHSNRTFFLISLCELYGSLFEQTGSHESIIAAEASGRAAISESAGATEDHAMALVAYWALHRQFPVNLVDVTSAADQVTISLQAGNRDDIDRDDRLMMLDSAYLAFNSRFEHSGDEADVSANISVARAAVSILGFSAEHWEWIGRLIMLLQERAERIGSIADVIESIEHAEYLLGELRQPYEAVGFIRSELSTGLKIRFQLSGNFTDLSEAIDAARRAQVESRGEDYLWQINQNLAMMLVQRYDHFGADEDIAEAVAISTEKGLPSSVEAAGGLVNLASLQTAKAGRTSDLVDFNKAVVTARRAVQVSDPFPQVLPEALFALSIALIFRLQVEYGGLEDGKIIRVDRSTRRQLDEAIQTARAAVFATPTDHHRYLARRKALALALETRFDYLRDQADIDDCIDLLDLGGMSVDGGKPGELDRFADLGISLRKRYASYRSRADADAAIIALSSCATSDLTNIPIQLNAATNWAALEAELESSSEQCIRAHERAVELLCELSWIGGTESDLFRRIGGWPSVANNAAACLLSAGRSVSAINILERGRAVVWSTIFSHGLDLSSVEEEAPALAAQITDVAVQLRRLYKGGVEGAASSTGERLQLAQRWRNLLEQGSQVDPSLTSNDFDLDEVLRNLPTDGVIVVVNAAKLRSDAIIIDNSGVTSVALPLLTAGSLQEQVIAYQGSFEQRVRPWSKKTPENVVASVLDWLWTAVAKPITDSSAFKGRDLSRIWWCLTGQLALLPIHAAEPRGAAAGKDVGLIDISVSSYIPTIRAFMRSQQGLATSLTAYQNSLLVSVPQSKIDGVSELPFVRQEVSAVRDTLDRSTLLEGEDATADRVLTELSNVSSVHFSCHGLQDAVEPSSSGLVLYDRIVTVREISERSSGGYLAFLSACDSALGSFASADEIVSLVGALQYSGWTHVIGTFAPVEDDIAAHVSQQFYEKCKRTDRSGLGVIAKTLRAVILELRRANPTRPSIWSPFVHFGP